MMEITLNSNAKTANFEVLRRGFKTISGRWRKMQNQQLLIRSRLQERLILRMSRDRFIVEWAGWFQILFRFFHQFSCNNVQVCSFCRYIAQKQDNPLELKFRCLHSPLNQGFEGDNGQHCDIFFGDYNLPNMPILNSLLPENPAQFLEEFKISQRIFETLKEVYMYQCEKIKLVNSTMCNEEDMTRIVTALKQTQAKLNKLGKFYRVQDRENGSIKYTQLDNPEFYSYKHNPPREGVSKGLKSEILWQNDGFLGQPGSNSKGIMYTQGMKYLMKSNVFNFSSQDTKVNTRNKNWVDIVRIGPDAVNKGSINDFVLRLLVGIDDTSNEDAETIQQQLFSKVWKLLKSALRTADGDQNNVIPNYGYEEAQNCKRKHHDCQYKTVSCCFSKNDNCLHIGHQVRYGNKIGYVFKTTLVSSPSADLTVPIVPALTLKETRIFPTDYQALVEDVPWVTIANNISGSAECRHNIMIRQLPLHFGMEMKYLVNANEKNNEIPYPGLCKNALKYCKNIKCGEILGTDDIADHNCGNCFFCGQFTGGAEEYKYHIDHECESVANKYCDKCMKDEDSRKYMTKAGLKLHQERECVYRLVSCDIKGCGETQIPFKNLKKHKQNCEFRVISCDYRNCNEKVRAMDMRRHKIKTCIGRMEKCRWCNVKKHYDTLEEHQKKCEHRIVECSDCAEYHKKKANSETGKIYSGEKDWKLEKS